MTVENNYAIAISTLSDWLKNLAPVNQQMKRKTNRDLHARFFPRFEQRTWNCLGFGSFHCTVCICCGWLKYLLWYLFYDIQLKTALLTDFYSVVKF